eukprot:1157702-Pelagomonas_calceolata.AAC.7
MICAHITLHPPAPAAGGSPGTPGGSGSRAGKPQFSKLYRFNEGYTNAVKRPLLMKDLLEVKKVLGCLISQAIQRCTKDLPSRPARTLSVVADG